MPFDLLFLQATNLELKSEECQDIMLEAIISRMMPLRTFRGYLRLILYRLTKLTSSDIPHILRLLIRIVQSMETKLAKEEEVVSVKKFLIEHKIIRNILFSIDLPESVVIGK